MGNRRKMVAEKDVAATGKDVEAAAKRAAAGKDVAAAEKWAAARKRSPEKMS